MNNWKTTLNLYHVNGILKSRPLTIRRGIFQGDSLSPLLFCIALAPLSNLLNSSNYGYNVTHGKLNHLFYMDDLKTFSKDDKQQEGLLNIVKTFSDDIMMEFGLDKCAKATFKKGTLTKTTDLQLDHNTKIKELEQEATYKYLGVNEGDGIQHSHMKEKIRKEYYRRIRLVLNTELNSANKIKAINTLAVPVVLYSFNIIKWKLSDILRLDTKTRKLLTMFRMHHPRADVDRLYVPRTSGGRGLVQLQLAYKTTTIDLNAYLKHTDDPLLQIVKQHEQSKGVYSVTKEATKFKQEFVLLDTVQQENKSATVHAKEIKQKVKCCGQHQTQKSWENKAMHGLYPKRVNDADVDKQLTHQWLRSSGLKAETESLIISAQDQCLSTKAYHHKILEDRTDPKCRMCGKYDETVDHIVSGCPELAKTEYINRHNKAASYIHWAVCKHYNIPSTTAKWYDHQPLTVTENENVTIL